MTPISINDHVWQLELKVENKIVISYPITVKGDFDKDDTAEILSRNNFYIFEDGWALFSDL